MTYTLGHFWFWLFAIFIAGLATALLARQSEQRAKVSPWLLWCGAAFVVGALLALLNVFVGRSGVWLETGLAAFASFITGAGAGVFARSGELREHKNWALGLIPAALLWFVGNLFGLPNVEVDLKKSVGAVIQNAGGDPHNFSVDGRDVTLSNRVADRAALASAIEKVEGVRLVTGADKLFDEAAEDVVSGKAAVEKAGDAGKKAAAGWADPGRSGYDADKAAGAGKAAVDQAKLATKQAPGQVKSAKLAEGTKAAKTTLKALPRSGPLDAASCQAALDATLVLDKIQFRSGSASIHRASAYALDRLAALLQRCPDAKVEIGGHTDNVGDDEDNRALSQRRADKVMQYLVNEGVDAPRLTSVGYGAQKPIASNNDDDGRAENRRIEFVVK